MLAPSVTPASDPAFPLEGALAGRLTLGHGAAARVSLRCDPDLRADLLRARFTGPRPRIAREGGDVRISHPRFPRPWLGLRPHASELVLRGAFPWRVALLSGGAHADINLRGAELLGLDVKGGLDDVTVRLPAPRGVVPIEIAGGVHRLRLLAPAAAPMTIVLKGGATRVALDEAKFGAVGGELRWASPGAAQAEDRYEVRVRGGAAGMELTREA